MGIPQGPRGVYVYTCVLDHHVQAQQLALRRRSSSWGARDSRQQPWAVRQACVWGCAAATAMMETLQLV